MKLAMIPLKLAQQPSQRQVEEKLISLLQASKNLKQIKQMQNQIIINGFEQNKYIVPNTVAAFAKSKKMPFARQVFDRILDPDVLLWNAMFKGYAENEFYQETFVLFNQMKSRDIRPNCFTFPCVLKSCGKISALREGEEVHCFVIKNGFSSNPFIGTTLIEMYSGGRAIELAYQVFSEMEVRNVVAWTSIIKAYISSDIGFARCLFDMSPDRDVILWNIMVSGYIGIGDMVMARGLFNEMPTRDVMSWNTILIGYVDNDDLKTGERFFEEIPEKNVFSWNGLIGGYALNGQFFEVLGAFKRMLIESNVRPNDATLVTVLSACSRLGALGLGQWVHVYAENNGYKGNVYVGNGLIDMYSKCGRIDSAIDMFSGMISKDLVTWNSMIGGLATHGRGADALNVFHQMMDFGEKPDGITFIGVLSACSHMGLVESGFSYFKSMAEDYSIVPQIEHYGCMVDLMARAGLLNEVMDFITKMPIEADSVIWSTLLAACKTYKNVQLAELSLEQLIKLEPENPANYVMLSNVYGETGRWEDVARLKVMMRERMVRKPPGCSLIEVKGSVAKFYSLDEKHPQRYEIYGVLCGLTKILKSSQNEVELEEFKEGT